MSENFWAQRKIESELNIKAEQEKKAAERREKKKLQAEQQQQQQTSTSTPATTTTTSPATATKEEKPKKKFQQKEQTKENHQQTQQQNGANSNGSSSTAAVPQKKKAFKNKKESASAPSTATTAAEETDFQTVERKTGGRRQFRGNNKRNNKKNNVQSENGEKKERKEKKEKKENNNKEIKKEEKTVVEPTVQPAQVKVFSSVESTVAQGSDSWVSLLRGNDSSAPSTTATTTSTPSTTTTQSKKKPSNKPTEKKTVVVKLTSAATTATAEKKPQKNYEAGKNLLRSTEVEIDQALLDEVGIFVQPRGMANINNTCYMNAVLQSLVSLPQFYHLFKKLGKISLDNEEYPLTNKFVRLISEFQPMKVSRPQSAQNGESEKKERKYTPFINAAFEKLTPSYIVDYIQQSSTNLEDSFLSGTQHDAHEFITFLLQRLHEELKKTETTLGRKSPAVNKKKNNKKTENTESSETTTETTEVPASTTEEWKEVGKKNKSNAIREHEMGDSSAISRVFCGKMKSFVQKQGETKGNSVVEPFFSLHLPIKDENIKGVKYALREMTKEENVSDKNAKSSIYQLPKVLLLHLRRFDYSSSEGVQKISKRIKFDYELNVDEKVVPNIKSISGRSSLKYRLASVICHHGKDATSGHYSTYIQHGCGKWIHIDDTKVTVVSLQHVLDQQAYILTYVQDDNQEHYKLYAEGSSSSPLFSESSSSEQNGEKKKEFKKKEKKEGKNVKKPITTPTETKTEAKTDV